MRMWPWSKPKPEVVRSLAELNADFVAATERAYRTRDQRLREEIRALRRGLYAMILSQPYGEIRVTQVAQDRVGGPLTPFRLVSRVDTRTGDTIYKVIEERGGSDA